MIYHDKILDDIVKDFFDSEVIKKNDNVIIALSGGMDSICLFDIFYKLRDEFKYNLYAVHIHHGIRGLEANRDMEFVKRYCKAMNVKLLIRKVDAINYSTAKHMSLEEAARALRYKEFDNIYREFAKRDKAHILVAQHLNDQVETITHNMLRGSGLKGLIGMKKVNGYILRPLLYVAKEEIIDYIKTYSLSYVNDSTNDDIKYTRNYIRQKIIPSFISVNDKACEHIVELSKEVSEIVEYIDALSKFSYDYVLKSKSSYKIVLDLDKFNALSNLVKSHIVLLIFKDLVNTKKDIGRVHIDDVIAASLKKSGMHLDLPYNITYDKKGKEMIFIKNSENISMSRRKKI